MPDKRYCAYCGAWISCNPDHTCCIPVEEPMTPAAIAALKLENAQLRRALSDAHQHAEWLINGERRNA